MTGTDFTFTYDVSQSPKEVYAAVLDVRGWWSRRIAGDTDRLGEFVYEVPGVHRAHMRITDLVPERRIIWHVLENWFASSPDFDEWAGSDIVFDIEPTGEGARLTFTHIGLTPELACYEGCATGWSRHALQSLRDLVSTGVGAPIVPADEAAFRGA
jgi:uncharacterized protein YndB with AHSA1/START domain